MILVYKITNKLDGKYYIGVHKTDNVDDDYMGSGKRIKSAVAKYGNDAFKKEIVEEFTTYEDAFRKEIELIDLADPLCYNLHVGGRGGFEYINSLNLPNPMTDPLVVARCINARKTTYESNKGYYDNFSRINLKKAHENRRGKKDNPERIAARINSLHEYYSKNVSKLKDIPLSSERKAKMSAGWTKEARDKKSQQQKDRIAKNPEVVLGALGSKKTQEAKQKIAAARRKYWESNKDVLITCPHCNKSGGLAMKRWHFNNCRNI